jgi:hypothetical protein
MHPSMDATNFHSVNNALITLIPKLAEAAQVKDYLPISLIHFMGKLILKVLSNRLACKLDKLIHITQSAFVCGRFIQDNFRLVHALAKLLHVRKQPTLLMKIDIARVFDSVS